LFHPRTDLWTDHFRFDEAWLLGLTPIGRVTIHVLAMNADDLRLFRAEILQEGIALAETSVLQTEARKLTLLF
jgi:hypothetical protein